MTGERLSCPIDAVQKVDIDLIANFGKGRLHRFADEGLGWTTNQALIVGIRPFEPVLRATKHGNGGRGLDQQLAPSSAIVFDLLRGAVLFSDVPRGTGYRLNVAIWRRAPELKCNRSGGSPPKAR